MFLFGGVDVREKTKEKTKVVPKVVRERSLTGHYGIRQRVVPDEGTGLVPPCR